MPKQHNSKKMKKLLRGLEQAGFVVSEKSKSGSVKIIPPKDVQGPIYCTHATESAYHQLRRDLAKMYGFDIIKMEFETVADKEAVTVG